MDRTGVATAIAPGTARILGYLLAGACLGAIGAALVWYLYPGFWKEPTGAGRAMALQQRQALQAQPQAGIADLPAPAQVAAAASPCDLEPLIPPGRAPDGAASVEHPFPADARARAKVFVGAAKAASAQGRPRDAETALLAACRESARASARPTVPLARVLGMLGEAYAAAARDSAGGSEQLLARARHVLALSADAYATALGPNASRSRHARKRLAALDHEAMAAVEDGDSQEMGPLAASRARAQPARKAAPPAAGTVARRGTVPPAAGQEPGAHPARAAVPADPELRQLASDLARLRAQVEAVSDDPEGFRRRAEAARAQQEQCGDAACLRRWYAARRQQLLAEF